MKKIRLIAMDLDGTLLDDAKQISPENREAIREAEARGVAIAIATGRMTPRIEPIVDQLGVDCIVIAYNGAKVVGTRAEGRPLLYHKPLAPDVAEFFVEFARSGGYLLNYYVDDVLYADPDEGQEALRELYTRRTGAEYELSDLGRFIGVPPTKLILLADNEERDRLYHELSASLGARAFLTRSEPEYLEVMAPGVDKGAALPAIAERLGITRDAILSIGDAENDLELVKGAGCGVALANARDVVKEAADAVTTSTNNEAGVAEAIRTFVL